MNNRYFKIYTGSNYAKMMVDLIKDEPGVIYDFTPDECEDYNDPNEKCGYYEFIINPKKYSGKVPLSDLSKYEYNMVYKEEYDKLIDIKAERSYESLYNKYSKTIQPVIDETVKEEVKKERERILNEDFAEEYKIEIYREAQILYDNFRHKFAKEECNIGELCDLYKKEIDATIHLKIEELIEYINKKYNMTPVDPPKHGWWNEHSKLTDKPFILDSNKKLTINDEEITIKSLDDIWKISRYTEKLKNDIVDKIVKMYGVERGMKDYWRVMMYAGKLADDIECSMKRLYIPHYIE